MSGRDVISPAAVAAVAVDGRTEPTATRSVGRSVDEPRASGHGDVYAASFGQFAPPPDIDPPDTGTHQKYNPGHICPGRIVGVRVTINRKSAELRLTPKI